MGPVGAPAAAQGALVGSMEPVLMGSMLASQHCKCKGRRDPKEEAMCSSGGAGYMFCM